MAEGLSAEETAQLQKRLEMLERRQRAITSKETLRELQYEVAETRWRLGLMSDEEFEEFEEFHDSFTFDY